MSASEQGVLNHQMNAAIQAQRPSVLYRPRLFADGSRWCALYGDDIQVGIAGFGETAEEAMYEFDLAWGSQKPPRQA